MYQHAREIFAALPSEVLGSQELCNAKIKILTIQQSVGGGLS
jgi:hypothetical protein